MKTLRIAVILSACFTSLGFSEIKLPRNHFPIKKLDQAISQAIEKGKPLIFVDT